MHKPGPTVMANIQDKWVQKYKPSASERIGGTVRPPSGPLKPRIGESIRMVKRQNGRLGAIISKLEQREKSLFQKVIAAKDRRDDRFARSLANELVELRKVKKIMSMARLSLEKMELRLSMYNDLGDTVVTIMPTISLMRSLGSSLGKFIPNADAEVGQMAEMLNGFMSNSLEDGAFEANQVSGEDVDQIMEQAAAVATESAGAKFPSMPAEVGGVRTGST